MASPTIDEASGFAGLIRQWGIGEFAADLGIQYGHAATMVRRNSVPTWYWPKLLQLAAGKGILLTADRLVAMKPERQSSAKDEGAAA